MTPAGSSVFYFGLYLYLVGLTLVFMPDVFLNILQLPETDDVWIRVVGVLAFCLGYYYHRAGKANLLAFCKYTIPTRILVFIAFTSFAALGLASPVLIGFGVVDLLGAIWTLTSLPKKDKQF